MMKKRESILTKRILAGMLAGVLLGSAFYARPAAAGEVINVRTQEDYEKVKDSNGDVKPQQSLTDNSVTIGTDGGGFGPSINGYVYGALSEGSDRIENNHVLLESGTITGDVYGGYSETGVTTSNSITITGGRVAGDGIAGGLSGGVAADNRVTISGGIIDGFVYGGYGVDEGAVNNRVSISDGEVGAVVFGGNSDSGDATGNNVVISGGKVAGDVHAGWSYEGAAINNSLVISGGKIGEVGSMVNGGFSNEGDAIGNSVNISGGEVRVMVHGGKSNSGAATNNGVIVSGGKILYKIYGGYGASATGNSVIVNGGEVGEGIYGGLSNGAGGAVTGNSVFISGGTINSDVYGGYSYNGDVTGNTVIISGRTDFDENRTVLYGGFSTNGTVSGNTLNFNSQGLTVKQVKNFEYYNFCLPGGTRAGNILLTMTADNGADISGSKVQVSAEGTAAAFKAGDQITLLYTDTPGIYSVIKADNMKYGKAMRQGVSVVYDITTGLSEDGHKLVTTINSSKAAEQSKSPVETQAATAAFLNSGADLLLSSGIASMTETATGVNGAIFGAMGGGSMRYKTGSYADVKGYNLALGFGKAVTNNAGKLTFGPFIEYGKGEYTSHLDGGIRGDGNAKYYGVGVLARQDNTSGVYYEGSLRYGRMDADYGSGDLINFADNRVQTSYDSSSAYYGAHLGIGKVTGLNDTTKADVYAKFMYTHQNGDSVALRGEGAGEMYDFDAVDSTRARIGARVSKAYNNRGTGYAGLAYEYEFDGEAKATVLGFSTPSPSIKGSSGLLELGYILQPKGVNDPAIDINLQGWGGKKQGFTGNVNFVWKF
ncbi:MAG: autotransporter outer membrane beta-barrel domain-containing protein [Phascolarctobacterium sp.]|uniref:autotransporter outer membrane beta-barrel domain-containing protein n=1 Tax=Phascolarctobacterium sp. TaxID=2049039 RepID=UPI0025DCB6A8|nr:autotransporter outer membrane beta-barrel domain-containing protein [Phascolarctobacterium sp.]MCC8157860.1 autotransporter outer membrane beta-barrel domain-containing protein [Phascolarctobacterium sp.]